jgi:hypothetical protein
MTQQDVREQEEHPSDRHMEPTVVQELEELAQTLAKQRLAQNFVVSANRTPRAKEVT